MLVFSLFAVTIGDVWTIIRHKAEMLLYFEIEKGLIPDVGI